MGIRFSQTPSRLKVIFGSIPFSDSSFARYNILSSFVINQSKNIYSKPSSLKLCNTLKDFSLLPANKSSIN